MAASPTCPTCEDVPGWIDCHRCLGTGGSTGGYPCGACGGSGMEPCPDCSPPSGGGTREPREWTLESDPGTVMNAASGEMVPFAGWKIVEQPPEIPRPGERVRVREVRDD